MATNQEGWRSLAGYLRAVQEARWAGLPPEAAAEEAWPHFQRAVMAALREGLALRGIDLGAIETDLLFSGAPELVSQESIFSR